MYKAIYFFLAIFFLGACSDDKNESTTRIQPPIGEIFSDGIITLVFESIDSIKYFHRDRIVEGKTAYIFKDGSLEITNPHGHRLDPKDVSEPYFLGLKGIFIDFNTIDVSYGIVSKNEKDQIIGHTYMYSIK